MAKTKTTSNFILNSKTQQMKITLNSKSLLDKLQFLGAVIPNSSTIPMLSNFLFEAKENQLKIIASDLETTISTTIEIQSKENSCIAIPAKLLIEILKSFADQPLTFESKEDSTIEIVSDSGKYSIAFYDGADYPKHPIVENPDSVNIPAKVLLNAITKTIFATGNDDLRPMMNGVFFEILQSGLNFVATDAHKLVKYSRSDIKSELSTSFIVPKKPLVVLKSMLGSVKTDVKIEFNTSNASFVFGEYIITSKLVDAKFPNYNAVIPKENPNIITIDRPQLLSSVKCVSIFSSKQTHQIHFRIAGNELNLSAEDIDYSNKANERISCDYNGIDLSIGFNARFLIEMLSNLQCDNVQLEMSEPNRAGILTPVDGLEDGESLLMLVMPVKLN